MEGPLSSMLALTKILPGDISTSREVQRIAIHEKDKNFPTKCIFGIEHLIKNENLTLFLNKEESRGKWILQRQ